MTENCWFVWRRANKPVDGQTPFHSYPEIGKSSCSGMLVAKLIIVIVIMTTTATPLLLLRACIMSVGD
jgi:hypothetical protein